MRLRAAVVLCSLACLAPGAAQARVLSAVSVLPPGQSGFVSIGGLGTGTGSPHLFDQQPLFTSFAYKSALFGRPATRTERPRDGIEITRDRFGVPSVTADTDAGVWWGAGYAVAQDRLFQLELFRRTTAGTRAALLGGSPESDISARRDYYTAAELDRQLASLPAELRARFAAYRDGVNAWLRHVQTSFQDRPGEFGPLNLTMAPWTVRDSARIGVLLARTIPSSDGAELDNLRFLRAAGRAAFQALLPLRVRGQIPTIPAAEGRFPSQPGRTRAQERAAFARSQRAAASFPLPEDAAATLARAPQLPAGTLGRPGGSSSFAVRGPRGHAVLFSGPQLGFSVPELFVELELHGPGIDVRGATAPGVPVLGVGRNAHVAWGLTSGLSDDNDLYAERLLPAQPERYIYKGGTRAMNCRTETFEIKGAPARTERLCRTLHGPVQARAGAAMAYARRYAIWGRELETLTGLAALNAARSIRDVDRALRQVSWNENVIAADDRGHIGYWHPGLLPLRSTDFDERLPYPGTGEAEWRGFLPRRADPHVIDPRQGWLANWNNVPSAGWTSGDAEATERLAGRFHRVALLDRLVARLARRPTFARAKAVIRRTGTTAQQRATATPELRAAAARATGGAAALLRAVFAWDGSYARTAADGTVDPGVVAWAELRLQAERLALAPFGPSARLVAGTHGALHVFDVTNGEAYALRTLSAAQLRAAAAGAFDALTLRFGSSEPARWRTPRAVYATQAQGGAQPPRLPFFDRGTWEQFVELGP